MSDGDYYRFLQRGAELSATGRLAEAIVEFERALALAPEDSVVLTAMADVFVSMGDYDRGKEYAAQAIAQNPENASAFLVLARRSLLRAYPHDAYRDAKQAMALAPDDLDCLRLFGFCALSLGRDEEARVLAELMLEQDPESVAAHSLMSMVAEEQKDLPTAIRHVEKTLELEPNDADALEQFARLQKELQRDHASADFYEAAVQANPQDPNLRSAMQESLHRSAFFGRPGERFASLGAALSAGLFAVIGLWLFAVKVLNLAEVFPNFNRVLFFAVPALGVAGYFLLRDRFIAQRYPQLAFAFRYLRVRARRDVIVGGLIILMCLGGIAYILARDGVDIFWVAAPLWLPFAAVWIALAMAPVGLLRALVFDQVLRKKKEAADLAATAILWRRRFLLLLAATMLVVTILSYSAWSWAPTLVLIVMATTAYFEVTPYRAILICFVVAWCVARYSFLFPTILDLQPGMAGLLLVILCLTMLYRALKLSLHRRWQRRRIRKLLGGTLSLTGNDSSTEKTQ